MIPYEADIELMISKIIGLLIMINLAMIQVSKSGWRPWAHNLYLGDFRHCEAKNQSLVTELGLRSARSAGALILGREPSGRVIKEGPESQTSNTSRYARTDGGVLGVRLTRGTPKRGSRGPIPIGGGLRMPLHTVN